MWTQEGALQGFESHHRQEFFFSLKGPDRLWCLASCSTGTEVISRKWSGRRVMLTTHLLLVPGLRMSGAITLLLLYALMAVTGALLLLLLVHIYQATRRHNLIHSSTRSWTPYLQIEIGGLNSPHKNSAIFCTWVVAKVTSWEAGVSLTHSLPLSLSHPPLLSLPQDLAPWMALDLCQAHVKYQTCRPFYYFRHESKSCAVSAADTDRTVPSVAAKVTDNIQTVSGRIVLETVSCWDIHNFININLFSLFRKKCTGNIYTWVFLQQICRFSHYTVCDFWQEHWKETKEGNI